MTDKYILVGVTPVQEPDLQKWGEWMERVHSRRVARTKMSRDTDVSTVFLGLDHSFGGTGPIVFETMVFGGTLDGETSRSGTFKQSVEQHLEMVNRVAAAYALSFDK